MRQWQALRDIIGKLQPAPDQRLPEGSLVFFSSHGPTLDGRLKPEICAPGYHLSTAFSGDLGTKPPSSVLTDATHMSCSGTSLSTPVVTGAVALMFQKNPQLNIEQIRSRIVSHPLTDIHTGSHGPLPNNIWGYGKLNIFNAITLPITPVSNQNPLTTKRFRLFRNYPNPFNSTTMIRYYTPRSSRVQLKVYNILGKEVRTLVNRSEIAGEKVVSWDTRNNTGHKVASGIYLYQIQASDFTRTYKMILLK